MSPTRPKRPDAAALVSTRLDHGGVDDAIRRLIRDELQPLRDELRAVVEELRSSTEPEGEFVSAEGAAKIAAVSPATVRTWVKQGRLKAHRAGRLLRVRRTDLESFLAGPSNPEGSVLEFQEKAAAILARRTKSRNA